MVSFTVNGTPVTMRHDQKLLNFLRDDLGLLSIKDGCSEGACGTCTVLVDGKARKSCVLNAANLEGTSVLTMEGLSDFERQVYVYAFGECGAVQCGYCTPGMVLAAKALLDQNKDPTRKEAAIAIRGNICRCTGYKKIIDAILMAARIFRENNVPTYIKNWTVGARAHRQDIAEKVLGMGKYTGDYKFSDMCYGSAVRSEYPRAIIRAVHTDEAKNLPGVIGVYTRKDIPGENLSGQIVKDYCAMIGVGEMTHFCGDVIALVAAESPDVLEEAKKLIEIEYEVLPSVHTIEEAMAPDAPLVHESGNLLAQKHICRGNADAAIAASRYVVSGHFSTPFNEHAFLEPECAVSFIKDEHICIYTSDQNTYGTMQEVAAMLGLSCDKVEVENAYVGGAFGGKEDLTVQHLSALITFYTGRPAQVKLSRAESLLVHPKRHPFEIDMTMGCDENGIIQGMKATYISDTGAYASVGGPVLERACVLASGPYNYQNLDIFGKAYYTNNPPAGAFRGFGVTQSCFATETLVSQLAEKVGISEWEIRYRNAIRPGQTLPNAQIIGEDTALTETLLAVKEAFENAAYAGIACSMKNAGLGHGQDDWGRCRIHVKNGKARICVGASDVGQGGSNVFLQIVGTTTGLDADQLSYQPANTFLCPDSGSSSGSRQTSVSGEACRVAAEKLAEDLKTHSLNELEGNYYDGAWNAITDKPDDMTKEHPISHVCYGYATQVCILDENGTIQKIIAAHDVGKAINPLAVEGQIEGGVVMSAGYALTEQFPLDDKGKPTAKFGTLGLLRADKAPDVEAIIVEKPGFAHSYGAKGVGEITAIPTPAAIAGAYHKFDGTWRYSLPLENTPYRKKKG